MQKNKENNLNELVDAVIASITRLSIFNITVAIEGSISITDNIIKQLSTKIDNTNVKLVRSRSFVDMAMADIKVSIEPDNSWLVVNRYDDPHRGTL